MTRICVIILFATILRPVSGQVLIPSDENSRVEFKIRNFGTVVEGSFTGITGKIRFDPSAPYFSQFDVLVDANTIRTGIGMRDNHLRKTEYLDVKRYPRIRFLASKVVASSRQGEYIITGDLTIKNKTKEITFPFYFNNGNQFKGHFEINRRDFDVGGRSISMADMLIVDVNISAKASPEKF